MTALVLTAGLGTRLDPLTRLVAKPVVPLGDRTLVEHILAWLARQHVTDLVLNLHHHPASVTAVVGDGRHLGLRVRYSWEPQLLGSAGGPRHALPLLASDPILIVNGDTLVDFDLAPMVAAHAASGADVTLAVVPNPAPAHYNGIRADASQVVTGFVPRGEAEGTWHYVGVQIARRRVFADLADGVPAETIAGMYRTIVATEPGRVRLWPVSTSFIDVGTPADYLAAAARLGATHDSAERPFVHDSAIWPGATVEAGARLTRCIVAGGAHVGAGIDATDRVIVPAATMAPGDTAVRAGDLALFPI